MNFKAFAVISFAAANGMLLGCKTAQPVSGNKDDVAVTKGGNPPALSTAPDWVAKPAPYQPTQTILTDLVHTKLRVSFDWQKQQLIGEATLTCKPYFYPQNTLVLDAKGFKIQSVELEGGGPLKYTYDGKKLNITLNKTYSRTQQYEVLINYIAKPNELKVGGSEAITSDKGLYFINPLGEEKDKPRQIWTQGETEASSCWFPTIDSPNQKMTQEIYITIEDNFKTLSNGTLVYSRQRPNGMRTDYWKQDLPHAPYLAMMAIGEYAVVKDTYKNKEVSYYVEPAYKNSARAIFGNTPEMLAFYSQKLGVEYPWDKYAQVIARDYVSGAMENTSATLHGDFVQQTKRELLDQDHEDVIAHELFHQWFGDLVTTESWSNLPLNESFATYGEYLWFEHKLGRDEADLGLYNDLVSYLQEAQQKRVPLIRYYYKDKEDMFDRHSYQKGGRVLHMLRTYVGDEAFFAALKKYLTDNKFKAAEIHNLRLAFEEVTGQDLNWFFDQWFLKPGHPELRVDQKYQDGKVTLRVFQFQDSVYSPLYKLPLKIGIWNNGKKTEHEVVVSGFRTDIELPAAAKPDLVIFDTDAQVLGTIMHEKADPEYVYQYFHADKFAHKLIALNRLADRANEPEIMPMYKAALSDKFWRLRSAAVYAFNATRFMMDDSKKAQKGTEAANPQLEEIKEKIKQIALSDPKNSVRADAISTLASFRNEKYTDIFAKALQDSSYAVAAAGVDALVGLENGNQFIQQIQKLSKNTNGNLASAIGTYYAKFGDGSEYSWFEKQINVLPNNQLHSFLQTFAGYLYKASPENRAKGIETLDKIARTNATYYVRLGALQGLAILGDEPGVKEKIAQIKALEKDPRLVDIYRTIP